jgi:CBS domain-containing protein
VGELVEPCIDDNSVPPETDALQALKRMTRDGRSRLLVVEDGRLRGVISLKDVSRLISLKLELET